jgi:hypothetical protein
VHLIFTAVVERHFLSHFGSSFAENFYALERIFPRAVGLREQVTRSLLACVLLPYLKQKCDRLFEKLRASPRPSRLARRFVALYPFVHLTWEGSVAAFWFLYAVGRRGSHSPLHDLAGCRLVAAERRETLAGRTGGHLACRAGDAVVRAVAASLQYGAFVLQFLDWW